MNSLRATRTSLALVAFAVFLLVPKMPQILAQETGKDEGKHIGTWKLVSTKYGDAKDFTPVRNELRLKIINPTHFTWVSVNESKTVESSAGGKYTLVGTTYTETIDFAGQGMESYLGKAQKFNLRVEGDKLYQSGELSDGLRIEEVWERVK